MHPCNRTTAEVEAATLLVATRIYQDGHRPMEDSSRLAMEISEDVGVGTLLAEAGSTEVVGAGNAAMLEED